MEPIIDQDGARYTLLPGLTEQQRQQLVHFSQTDLLIIRNTSDPQRFASETKLATWLVGDRLVFALTPSNAPDQLAGLAWFSHEAYPLSPSAQAGKPQWTFAIRLYESARGKRLSVPFMTAAFAAFEQKHPHQSVWLSTNENNAVSQKIYAQFGFQKQAQQDGRVFYVYNSVV